MPQRCRKAADLAHRLWDDKSGSVLMTFCVVLPVLAFIAVGTADYASVVSDRSAMQGIADNAALAAATQLSVDTSSATAARAQSLAQSQLTGLIGSWTLQVSSAVVNSGKAVQVTISGTKPALLQDLLPDAGWRASVTATAQAERLLPLCALGMRTGGALLGPTHVVDLRSSSQVTAPNCMVQSNQDVAVENSAQISAGAVQAVGQATGTITPTPQTGAPPIRDPFAATNISIPGLCTDVSLVLTTGTRSLAPGVHCGTIVVGNDATLRLDPGVHYFFGATLTLQNNATLQGTDVALVFDVTSFFTFQDSSDIELEGLTSGSLAGFVIASAHDNAKTFTISTTSAHKLLGVVYIPSGLLKINGTNPVAEASDWTVIVANTIAIDGSANLTLNANYGGSTVPVPAGIGSGGVYLSN